jgi:predicted ester cyclase
MAIQVDEEAAEADLVAQHWTVRMRHTGDFQSIPATNRAVTFCSVWFYRVVDDRVVEAWSMDQEFIGLLK